MPNVQKQVNMIVSRDNRITIKLYLESTARLYSQLHVATDKRIAGCAYNRKHMQAYNELTIKPIHYILIQLQVGQDKQPADHMTRQSTIRIINGCYSHKYN